MTAAALSGTGSAAAADPLAAWRRAGASTGTGTATAAGAASGEVSADESQDRFMKLLVAQMRNQDPLNPLDNAQVTSQLAQISTVRGVESLRSTMSTLAERLGGGQAASLVGRDVLVSGDRLALGASGSVRAGVELSGDAARVELRIADASGRLVDTMTIDRPGAGVRMFEWDGTGSDGRRLPAGDYTVSAAATGAAGAGAAAQLSATVLAPAAVRAVTVAGDGGWRLQLDGLGSRPWADLRAVL